MPTHSFSTDALPRGFCLQRTMNLIGELSDGNPEHLESPAERDAIIPSR